MGLGWRPTPRESLHDTSPTGCSCKKRNPQSHAFALESHPNCMLIYPSLTRNPAWIHLAIQLKTNDTCVTSCLQRIFIVSCFNPCKGFLSPPPPCLISKPRSIPWLKPLGSLGTMLHFPVSGAWRERERERKKTRKITPVYLLPAETPFWIRFSTHE